MDFCTETQYDQFMQAMRYILSLFDYKDRSDKLLPPDKNRLKRIGDVTPETSVFF